MIGMYHDVQKLKEILSYDQKETITERMINSDVSLQIKTETLSNTKATFIFANNSKTTVVYSYSYWIEREDGDNWSKVKMTNDMNFTPHEFGCYPKEKKEIEIDWEFGYGALLPGKYRIVKEVSFEYEDDTRENFYVMADFTIKT